MIPQVKVWALFNNVLKKKKVSILLQCIVNKRQKAPVLQNKGESHCALQYKQAI